MGLSRSLFRFLAPAQGWPTCRTRLGRCRRINCSGLFFFATSKCAGWVEGCGYQEACSVFNLQLNVGRHLENVWDVADAHIAVGLSFATSFLFWVWGARPGWVIAVATKQGASGQAAAVVVQTKANNFCLFLS